MIRPLLFVVLAGLTSAQAADDQQDEFTLLQLAKQPAESLSYFVRRAPVDAPDNPEQPTKFEPLPDGITAHLSEVGYLVGRRLFAVRYLADARLNLGNDGAVGLVLLCSISSEPPRFAPLVVAWGD